MNMLFAALAIVLGANDPDIAMRLMCDTAVTVLQVTPSAEMTGFTPMFYWSAGGEEKTCAPTLRDPSQPPGLQTWTCKVLACRGSALWWQIEYKPTFSEVPRPSIVELYVGGVRVDIPKEVPWCVPGVPDPPDERLMLVFP